MSDIKEGDYIVCIDAKGCPTGMTPRLTFGKIYKVVKFENPSVDNIEMYDLISVIDDSGKFFGYYQYRFISLAECRRKKLERLNMIDV